jgi:phosphatidylglycerophosphate synthase
LDGCDGEVAQIKFKSSKRGAFIDTITDHMSYMAFSIGVTFGAYNATGSPVVFVVTGIALFLLFFALKSGIRYVSEQGSASLRDLDQGIASLKERKKWYLKLFGILHPLGRRDMFSFVAMLLMFSGNITFFWLCLMTVIYLSIIAYHLFLRSVRPPRSKRSFRKAAKHGYQHVLAWFGGDDLNYRTEEIRNEEIHRS